MIRAAALALATLLAVSGPAAPADGDPSPQQIVAAIYAAYGRDTAPEDVPGRFFAPELLALYDEVAAGTGEGEIGIDFDIFIDAQDIDPVADLRLFVWDESPATRVIDARFTVFAEPRLIRYSFVTTPQGWKISNIVWRGESENLRNYLLSLKAKQGGP